MKCEKCLGQTSGTRKTEFGDCYENMSPLLLLSFINLFLEPLDCLSAHFESVTEVLDLKLDLLLCCTQ